MTDQFPGQASTIDPNYRLKHMGGSIMLGVIALAAYIQGINSVPKTAWEWTVVALIGASTILKAIQSDMGATTVTK